MPFTSFIFSFDDFISSNNKTTEKQELMTNIDESLYTTYTLCY